MDVQEPAQSPAASMSSGSREAPLSPAPEESAKAPATFGPFQCNADGSAPEDLVEWFNTAVTEATKPLGLLHEVCVEEPLLEADEQLQGVALDKTLPFAPVGRELLQEWLRRSATATCNEPLRDVALDNALAAPPDELLQELVESCAVAAKAAECLHEGRRKVPLPQGDNVVEYGSHFVSVDGPLADNLPREYSSKEVFVEPQRQRLKSSDVKVSGVSRDVQCKKAELVVNDATAVPMLVQVPAIPCLVDATVQKPLGPLATVQKLAGKHAAGEGEESPVVPDTEESLVGLMATVERSPDASRRRRWISSPDGSPLADSFQMLPGDVDGSPPQPPFALVPSGSLRRSRARPDDTEVMNDGESGSHALGERVRRCHSSRGFESSKNAPSSSSSSTKPPGEEEPWIDTSPQTPLIAQPAQVSHTVMPELQLGERWISHDLSMNPFLAKGSCTEQDIDEVPLDECQTTAVETVVTLEAVLPQLPNAAKSHIHLAEEEEQSVKKIGSLAHRPEFTIVVDRKEGSKLGIDIQVENEELVIKGIAPGLIYSSIAQNSPSAWARPEDRIVDVNGICRGNADKMMEETAKIQVLHLTIAPGLSSSAPKACLSTNAEVYVNVYDLMPQSTLATLNSFTSNYGLFHTSVELFGREWYFSGAEDSLFYGVFSMPEPRVHPYHVYRRSVHMGRTLLSPEDFEDLMPLIRISWPSWSYHAFNHNCHHFSDFLCKTLGFAAAPKFGLFGAGDPELAKEKRSEKSSWHSGMNIFKVASCFPSFSDPRTASQPTIPPSFCGAGSWAGAETEIRNPCRRIRGASTSELFPAISNRDDECTVGTPSVNPLP